MLDQEITNLLLLLEVTIWGHTYARPLFCVLSVAVFLCSKSKSLTAVTEIVWPANVKYVLSAPLQKERIC